LGVAYSDYAVLAHVLPQPALRGSPWCHFHAATFNLIVLLLLACHARAVLADPGLVPLPATAIDFSDLWKPEESQEDWTVCDCCEAFHPSRTHHCRICHRCVCRMDHHCPWINNCVGELNQKYFIQCFFYTGLASLYAVGLVLAAWLGQRRKETLPTATSRRESGWVPSALGVGGGGGTLGVAGLGSDPRPPSSAHCIVLLLESLLFGAFVAVVFYDQV
ncbi:ZDHC3 Palmitoyltransferase, partial [Bucorvus abyssinicus]|nr:ZDHC3 Palmitoyltransferase [Bucorvus abyssinicus]